MAESVNKNGAAEAAPQGETVNPSDIFLTEINITHVRHLQGIVIPLSKTKRKNLILTGENGSGKSSVLEALKLYLAEKVGLVRLNRNEKGEIEAKELRVKARANVRLPKMRKLYENSGFILAQFDDERRIDPKGMFSQSNTVRAVIQDSNSLLHRFTDILRVLYDDSSLNVTLSLNLQDNKRLMPCYNVRTAGRNPFDFNTMASGFSAVFDVIADILMRMESVSPGNYDLPGIVLIDEIEVHLHVSLQKKILPILTELFPNLQFIVTTHSPFVLASAKNAVVYDLEHRTLAADGLSNVSYSGIVEGYFNVDEMSEKLERELDDYRALAAKKKWTDRDYAEADRLETDLDAVPDFLAGAWKAEYSRLKLEIAADKGE